MITESKIFSNELHEISREIPRETSGANVKNFGS
jgi:hypothetical protein